MTSYRKKEGQGGYAMGADFDAVWNSFRFHAGQIGSLGAGEWDQDVQDLCRKLHALGHGITGLFVWFSGAKWETRPDKFKLIFPTPAAAQEAKARYAGDIDRLGYTKLIWFTVSKENARNHVVPEKKLRYGAREWAYMSDYGKRLFVQEFANAGPEKRDLVSDLYKVPAEVWEQAYA